MPSRCTTCNTTFNDAASLRAHRHSSARHSPWPYCKSCERKFVDSVGLDAHLRACHKPSKREKHTIDHLGRITLNGIAIATQFHCCECDRDFINELALNQHLRDKVHVPESEDDDDLVCKKCDKEFGDEDALRKHLASVVHNPLINNLKCIAGAKCTKTFTSPSAMLHHLESGGCSSGINRKKIDRLIAEKDSGNLITSGITGNIIYDSDSDDDDYSDASSSNSTTNGVPIFTPTSSTKRNSLNRLRDSMSTSFGGALTPGSDNHSIDAGIISHLEGKRPCPICPPTSTRKFHSAEALWAHMTSAAHAPKSYHCPLTLVPENIRGKNGVMAFTTLSGLTQHLESGACKGGKQTFKNAISFVNGKLREFGFADMKLIG